MITPPGHRCHTKRASWALSEPVLVNVKSEDEWKNRMKGVAPRSIIKGFHP